jgi:hypothetical protein
VFVPDLFLANILNVQYVRQYYCLNTAMQYYMVNFEIILLPSLLGATNDIITLASVEVYHIVRLE